MQKLREAYRQYNRSEKGKSRGRAYVRRNPDKNLAHVVVFNAIKAGKLPAPNTFFCSQLDCLNKATEYHHAKGYERKFQLVVEPVCRLCHVKIHI